MVNSYPELLLAIGPYAYKQFSVAFINHFLDSISLIAAYFHEFHRRWRKCRNCACVHAMFDGDECYCPAHFTSYSITAITPYTDENTAITLDEGSYKCFLRKLSCKLVNIFYSEPINITECFEFDCLK